MVRTLEDIDPALRIDLDAYWEAIRKVLTEDMSASAFIRAGNAFIWCVPYAVPPATMDHLRELWTQRVPGYELLIIQRSVFIPEGVDANEDRVGSGEEEPEGGDVHPEVGGDGGDLEDASGGDDPPARQRRPRRGQAVAGGPDGGGGPDTGRQRGRDRGRQLRVVKDEGGI